MTYDFKKIENKWQKAWEKDKKLYSASDTSKKSKYYCLVEFPYPSGEGLHVGHTRSYTAMDIIARKRRMEGYNVLYPIGWDAFGLPTENYAIKTGVHPKVVTKKNTDNFRRQLKSLGFSFDWAREINTTDPQYYKWTQWIFLQFFKKGLAYKAKMPINWCLSCKIGLANEEVIEGKCERCGGQTEKRDKEQWMLAITKYADRLDKDLDKVDFLEKIKIQQRNWIGRSEGAIIKFPISNFQFSIEVFTTRADTLFGATYLVLSPEYSWIEQEIRNPKSEIRNKSEVQNYINKAKTKTEIERTAETKDKTGVELKGIKAINPANGEEIPVWVADYVLGGYGTGAIMAVPAHDQRDHDFAKKYDLLIKQVVVQNDVNKSEIRSTKSETNSKQDINQAYESEGVLINSGEFDGMDSAKAKKEITKYVGGKITVKYKLRDWVFSRQRYWGEPIPIIHCEQCGMVPVPEKDLPVKLPDVKKYQPTDTGESPLARVVKWINVKCPKCKGKAKRETDVMPNWAGSSWYYLAYIMRGNSKFKIQNSKLFRHWMPVDWYNGGMEHTTLHLLYSRFWNKFLYDIGVASTDESYKKRTSHGMVLGEGGEKMSKSRGNVVNPDDVVSMFGADAFRVYEMFMGPFDQAIPWSTDGLKGMRRFLDRVFALSRRITNHESQLRQGFAGQAGITNKKVETLLHQTIKKVTEDIESMKFNTAVSTMMVFVNELEKQSQLSVISYQLFVKLLAPFAPHIAEEIWKNLGNKTSIHLQKWPKFDLELAKEEEFDLVIQINGKTRAVVKAGKGVSEKEAQEIALLEEKISKLVRKEAIKKTIFVKDRLINFII